MFFFLCRPYVFCDKCLGWFHTACVGITYREACKLPQFLCPQCVTTNSKQLPKQVQFTILYYTIITVKTFTLVNVFTVIMIYQYWVLILIKSTPITLLSPRSARRPAGEGANIDRRLVPYMRYARRTKSRIEFIYLYIYIYASTAVLMRAHRNFGPGK